VDFLSPVPRLQPLASRLLVQPLDDDLSSPWACVPCISEPAFRAGLHDLRHSLRPMTPPAAFTADAPTELGPCSLAPAALFGARLTSVFETDIAYRLLQQRNDVRATKPGLI